jgi:hypothetical protein
MAGSGRQDPRDHDADDRGDQRQLSEAGQRDLLALDGDGDVGGPGVATAATRPASRPGFQSDGRTVVAEVVVAEVEVEVVRVAVEAFIGCSCRVSRRALAPDLLPSRRTTTPGSTHGPPFLRRRGGP